METCCHIWAEVVQNILRDLLSFTLQHFSHKRKDASISLPMANMQKRIHSFFIYDFNIIYYIIIYLLFIIIYSFILHFVSSFSKTQHHKPIGNLSLYAGKCAEEFHSLALQILKNIARMHQNNSTEPIQPYFLRIQKVKTTQNTENFTSKQTCL